MSYLAKLKALEEEKTGMRAEQVPTKPTKPSCVSFVSTPPAHFQENIGEEKTGMRAEQAPTKPTKPSCVSFVGTPPAHFQENIGGQPAFRAWRLTFTNRDPIRVHCWPPATETELLAEYPNAEALEPLADWDASAPQPGSTLPASEQQPDAAPGDGWPADDRVTCRGCANLHPGRCLAATRGEISGVPARARSYRPDPDLLRRCEGFLPVLGSADRRTGAERWPELVKG